MVQGLFITGTDTGVGKTYVAALVARELVAAGRRVGVYKPAASGCTRQGGDLVSDDAVMLWEAAGRPGELAAVCPQRFIAPLAPHLAAKAEGCQIDADLLRRGLDYWRPHSDVLIVEGAGGLMSPIGDAEYVADLAHDFGFPLVVVSRNVLGTINQTLQTLIAARCYGRQETEDRGRKTEGKEISREADKEAGKEGSTSSAHFTPFSPCSPLAPSGLPVAGIVLNHPTPPSAGDVSLASNRAELNAHCGGLVLAEVFFGSNRFEQSVDWFALAGGDKGGTL